MQKFPLRTKTDEKKEEEIEEIIEQVKNELLNDTQFKIELVKILKEELKGDL